MRVEASKGEWKRERKGLDTAAEFSSYQAIETECEKWDVRESCMLSEMIDIKAELVNLRVLRAESVDRKRE